MTVADNVVPPQQNADMSRSNRFFLIVCRYGLKTFSTTLCSLAMLLGGCGAGVTGNSGTVSSLAQLQPIANALPVDSTLNSTAISTVDGSAAPIPPESASCISEISVIREHMLALINEARAEARSCGNEVFEATGPVTWNEKLAMAARAHSDDMAIHNFFSHTGSDGSSASDRATQAGYQWRSVGENIAAGRSDASDTLSDWLGSAGHCKNLMNPNFTEVAVVCVENENSDFQRYWTNTLGSQG